MGKDDDVTRNDKSQEDRAHEKWDGEGGRTLPAEGSSVELPADLPPDRRVL